MMTIAELFDLRGKVAIVTGGAMGIGKGISMRLAEAGASIMIPDLNLEVAQKTAAEIKALGGKATAIQADVSNINDAQKVIDATLKAFGDLDIMVNNAGIYRFMPAIDMTEAMWDKTLGINLKGLMFFSQAATKAMMAAKHGGKIINIASIDGFRPTGNLAHYDASKGGVIMLTKAMAQEWAPHGILVNAVAPGGINTPGASALMPSGSMSAEQLMELSKSFVAKLPLKRMGEPDDIGKVVLFLASAAADYMVGSVIVADGGALLV
ncbi:short-chain dehydrogenase [Dehalococcoides mccartyi]|uniref:SDR family NAD(P)-dependent oxidoreductase n=1 Tax=Dehalococcoides mccartyi TaxID=61435 RepID=UPI0002B76920|nr:SDR family oxidoreductase [Dehalococcoides mccartyi]AGG07756.1 short-chain dehydrogenase/reductase family (SDR) protein [Dehalococcoides mccartyi BTF08]AQW62319.1 short-chain dehydrogenase [Dehalococcoides mccartyi]KSV16959.1 short-chain dehydrogenase [Dehalococcoides mccartyi]